MTLAVVALVTVIVALLVILERQRRDHQTQLDALLDRVRSPVLHKPEPKPVPVQEVPAVGWDDDAAYWEVTNGRS